MNRRVRALSLALFATFAVGAIMAQGAMATNHTFVYEDEPSIVTGAGENHIFEATEVPLACEEPIFAGTAGGESVDRLRLHPSYNGKCELGPVEVSIDYQGCVLVFDSDTTSTSVEQEHAPMTIECEEEIVTSEAEETATEEIAETEETEELAHIKETDETREAEEKEETEHFEATQKTREADHKKVHTVPSAIKVTAPGCTLKTPVQTVDGIRYDSEGSGSSADLKMTATVVGITYEVAEEGFCFLFGLTEGTHHDGAYAGTTTLRAYEDKGVHGNTEEGLAGLTFTEGAQIGMGITTP